METHIIEQTDQEGNKFNWVAIDEETARQLWDKDSLILFYVREDAEGLIEDEEDLELAIKHNAVCIEDSYLWFSEFEEGEQNRFRNNNFQSFEDWCIEKVERYY